jgi:polo-like kinase 1
MNHPYIVNFIHVFEDTENVYILLEICTNQTLNELCKRRKRLSEFEAKYYSA